MSTWIYLLVEITDLERSTGLYVHLSKKLFQAQRSGNFEKIVKEVGFEQKTKLEILSVFCRVDMSRHEFWDITYCISSPEHNHSNIHHRLYMPVVKCVGCKGTQTNVFINKCATEICILEVTGHDVKLHSKRSAFYVTDKKFLIYILVYQVFRRLQGLKHAQ
jgi:hypothetical protein